MRLVTSTNKYLYKTKPNTKNVVEVGIGPCLALLCCAARLLGSCAVPGMVRQSGRSGEPKIGLPASALPSMPCRTGPVGGKGGKKF